MQSELNEQLIEIIIFSSRFFLQFETESLSNNKSKNIQKHDDRNDENVETLEILLVK